MSEDIEIVRGRICYFGTAYDLTAAVYQFSSRIGADTDRQRRLHGCGTVAFGDRGRLQVRQPLARVGEHTDEVLVTAIH